MPTGDNKCEDIQEAKEKIKNGFQILYCHKKASDPSLTKELFAKWYYDETSTGGKFKKQSFRNFLFQLLKDIGTSEADDAEEDIKKIK